MIKVFGDLHSGNCYKVQLLCELLNLPYAWIEVDILQGDTHSTEFLQKNPAGKIPVVELATGEVLSESNAIINYLAANSGFYPSDALSQARIQQWQFFEQYSHEPFIAVARFIAKYLGLPEQRRGEYEAKQAGGYKALAVMEKQLQQTAFLTGTQLTTADISLFAYTHVAHEGGFDLTDYPAIKRWVRAIEQAPNFTPMAS